MPPTNMFRRIGQRRIYPEAILFLLAKDLIANYCADYKTNRCHHENTNRRYLRFQEPDLQTHRNHPDKVGNHDARDDAEQNSHKVNASLPDKRKRVKLLPLKPINRNFTQQIRQQLHP